MIVSELMAMLSQLPGDTIVLVNHERIKLHPPELFASRGDDENPPFLMIVPALTVTFTYASECLHWRHIQPAE